MNKFILIGVVLIIVGLCMLALFLLMLAGAVVL